jgi:hypothetical protein
MAETAVLVAVVAYHIRQDQALEEQVIRLLQAQRREAVVGMDYFKPHQQLTPVVAVGGLVALEQLLLLGRAEAMVALELL